MAKVRYLNGEAIQIYRLCQRQQQCLKSLVLIMEMKVISAHREPDVFVEYAKSAESKGIDVIIAGAGGAAHLPRNNVQQCFHFL